MSAEKANLLRLVKKWIDIAESDYSTCRGLQSLSPAEYGFPIAFHAQQAAEKYLKGWLELKEFKFPYTHDISRLLDICKDESGVNWAEDLTEAEDLTPYAVQFRYPFEQEKIGSDEALAAIRIADHVRQVLRGALREEIVRRFGADDDPEIQREFKQLDLWKKQ